jgi:hypothetical protein
MSDKLSPGKTKKRQSKYPGVRSEIIMRTGHKELLRHRWYWTLNPDNPNRVSVAEYMKQVKQHKK